jgi:hypothetical protein
MATSSMVSMSLRRPSASSKYDFGIEVFQFPTCVVDLELPIDASLLGVAGLVPGSRFLAESGHVA